MLTRHQDAYLNFRKIRMDFMNPPHLEDCLAHCRQHGLTDRFNAMLANLRQRAMSHALSGDEAWIRLIPNSRTQPTFAWMIHLGSKPHESGRVDYSTTTREWTIVAE